MILVTVGTHYQGFERLVKAADELAKGLDEAVIIQYGASAYLPRYAEAFQWASGEQMEQLTQAARVVISHAAAGAILLALQEKKPLVLAPRRKAFHEHDDDHQLQLAKVLHEAGQAVTVDEPSAEGLRNALAQATKLEIEPESERSLSKAICDQLNQWEAGSAARKNKK